MNNDNAQSAIQLGAQSPAWRRSLAQRLLAWFGRNARDLPWRRTRDLYAIWISEIMLQQTQVATVIPYFERFLARFPDVTALAAAEEHDVLQLWEGLGYYRRARQLHAAAKHIVAEQRGHFPTAYDGARALPGIGRYTAGAILSIGLDQRLPILEANTQRVLSRLTAYRGDVRSSAGQRHLWALAESLLPQRACGAFNQALMELGSEICTPRSPGCNRCPVANLCKARRHNLTAKIPGPLKPKDYVNVTEVAVVVRDGDRVVLRRCQPGERWAGLWDFPRFSARNGSGDAATDPRIGQTRIARQHISQRTRELTGMAVVPGSHIVTLKHGVTRFRITLHCYEASLQRAEGRSKVGSANQHVRWVPIEALAVYPLSTTGRKISRLLAGSDSIRRKAPASAARPQRSRRRSC